MPIRVILVRVLLARAVGQQHHKVQHQIGQAMFAVRNQALRLRQHANDDLRRRQHQIHRHAHPRRTRTSGRALTCGDRRIVVVFFVDVGEGLIKAPPTDRERYEVTTAPIQASRTKRSDA